MEIKTISYVGYKDTPIDLELIDDMYRAWTGDTIEDKLIVIKDVRENLNDFITQAKMDREDLECRVEWSEEDAKWLTSLIVLERRLSEVEEFGASHIQF
jgi:hypothetical protein